MTRVFWFTLSALVAFGAVAGAQFVRQNDDPPIDRVEEDWELVVEKPDLVGAGPQITTCMSPSIDLVTVPFVAFDVNYREYPDFVPGGMQIQVWLDKSLGSTATQEGVPMSTNEEHVTWTQRLTVTGGSVEYRILNGHSDTWGEFGGTDALSVTFTSEVTNLNSYNPDFSLHNSGVGWQADHVRRLQLLRVRYYSGQTLITTDLSSRSLITSN